MNLASVKKCLPGGVRSILWKVKSEIELLLAIRDIKKNQFWFVDVPRTSTSSIKAELGARFGPAYGKSHKLMGDRGARQWVPDHVLAREMKAKIGDKEWSNLFSFSVVRNPWDRLLSLYHFRIQEEPLIQGISFSRYVALTAKAREPFVQGSWKPSLYFPYQHYLWSCWDYVSDSEGELIVSEIIRFEDRNKGLDLVAQKIALSSLGSVKINHSIGKVKDFRESYDSSSVELVAEAFADDLSMFGYEF